jgi:hypothetical protein
MVAHRMSNLELSQLLAAGSAPAAFTVEELAPAAEPMGFLSRQAFQQLFHQTSEQNLNQLSAAAGTESVEPYPPVEDFAV